MFFDSPGDFKFPGEFILLQKPAVKDQDSY